ncbi:MAG: hypothetical protein RIC56_09515 [Pseudomonadales bacterium]
MERPDFAIPIADNGYAWWYVDAVSDDGCHALTVIAFVGSVFSPYYARARRRAAASGSRANPEDHVAINAVLYGPRGKRWAMTERGAAALQRSRDQFRASASEWRWENDGLTIDVNEIGVPWPRRLRGQLRLVPQALNEQRFELAAAGQHTWQPFAPRARVEVRFSQPELSWSGAGYLDGNRGDTPLSDAFRRWHWSRLTSPERTEIVYDLQPREGSAWSMALQTTADGRLVRVCDRHKVALSTTGWRVQRQAPAGTRLTRTLEDTPFYARSAISGRLAEDRGHGVHESLDLDRLRSRWVNLLLPFRMPRRAGASG